MIEGRITRIGDSWGVILPKPLRDRLNWWPRDTVVLIETKDGLLLQNSTQQDVKLVSRVKTDDVRRNS